MGMLPVYAATANYFGKAGAGVDQFEWFDRAWKFVDEKYGRASSRATPSLRKRSTSWPSR